MSDQQDQLFNSYDKPIPGLRGTLDIMPVEQDGEKYLYFHDNLGYATPNFALKREAAQILRVLDGQRSINELSEHFGEDVTADKFLEYIRFLDKQRLLYSDYFENYAQQHETQFESQDERKAASSGISYPEDKDELLEFLEEAFSNHEHYQNGEADKEASIKALYAPHIDPRVGMDSYVRSFSAIKNLEPKRIIVLATSHYAGLYPETYAERPFILSDKNFTLPHGDIPSDEEAVQDLKDRADEFGISTQDRAHRIEHSIELHLLFLRYMWDHDFKIVPLLVDSLHDLYNNPEGELNDRLHKLGKHLYEQYGGDEETLFLISGDLSHVGEKFGDEQPARQMFQQIKNFDRNFMDYALQADRERMFKLMKKDQNPYRICGFTPLYTFLHAFPNLEGEELSYDIWDESERNSAVSYASILYRQNGSI